MSPTLLRLLIQRRRPVSTPSPDCLTHRPTSHARNPPRAFVELDTRHNDGYTVSLEWNRDTGTTQIVVDDTRAASPLVIPVPAADASDAFRHPFRYAPGGLHATTICPRHGVSR
jgi:hypothetical protein